MHDQERLEFRKKVRKHWISIAREDHDRWETYIKEFLPQELELSKNRLPMESREVLILMVGFSFEPLLQACCAWKPKKLILLFNSNYTHVCKGENVAVPCNEWGNEFQERLNLLADKPPAVRVELHNDHPLDVFWTLNWELPEHIQGVDRKQIVIDITGGKKATVAGAYLFAAFAGIDVSYVDFVDGSYDVDFGKPYGDGCEVGLLENPYKLFALREWQRAEELYKRHAFQAARELVEDLRAKMSEVFSKLVGAAERGEKQAADNLSKVLAIFEIWDRADYRRAREKVDKLNTSLRKAFHEQKMLRAAPTGDAPDDAPDNAPREIKHAIETLGSMESWPRGNEPKGLLEQAERMEYDSDTGASFYLDPHQQIYAEDELARIGRLIDFNGDFRSGFLRAVGLLEFLASSRIAICVLAGKVDVQVETNQDYQPFDGLDDDLRRKLQKGLQGKSIVFHAMQSALKKKRKKIKFEVDDGASGKRTINFKLNDSAPVLPDNAALKSQYELRNKAIHTSLWIPKGIARETYEIAKNNVRDFAENWLVLLRGCTLPGGEVVPHDWAPPLVAATPLPWEELLELCGVDFLSALKLKGD